jgi:hypothetical protein
MKFSIVSIILWPRQGQFQPRIVPFKAGAVNVISGRSRTGKSAIIPIIDYCLGSDKCTIPVATIRDACSWFGVLVETEQGQKLFARREPGAQRSTSEMYVEEGEKVEIPASAPTKNATVDFVKGRLDDLAGLTSLDFEPGAGGFKTRPSFRDLMAFTFQPQNVVANPNTLFYKADSYEHREKLRILFPYALGAVTPDMLAKKHELEELKRVHRRKKLELETVRNVSVQFLAQMQTHLNRLKEFGLIPSAEDINVDQYRGVQILRGAVSKNREFINAAPSVATITVSSDDLMSLRKLEGEQSTALASLRQRFFEMTELRKNSLDYRGALIAQKDRLAISKWMRHRAEEDHDCPVCGNAMNQQEELLEVLLTHLEEIESTATHFQTVPASLDREYQRVRSEMETIADALSATQLRLRELRNVSESEQKRQYTEISMSRYIGRIEADLRVLESVGQDSDLQAELDALEDRIRGLEKEVNPLAIRERTNRALNKVSALAAQILPVLDVERPNDALKLSIQDLTIKVESTDREDFLWEIGSGSNWLSYHVATSVALQLFFGQLDHSPVPSFLVYDQPSQVYFPQRLVDKKEDEPPTEEDPKLRDEDVEAVGKVFKALSGGVESSKGTLQIIVLDHAPETVWANVPNVNYVEEWRGSKKLVPLEWINQN